MAAERQNYRDKFILALFILISVACFCQFDPYAHLLTTKEPDAAEVTGFYLLKEQTLTDEGLNFLRTTISSKCQPKRSTSLPLDG